MHIPGESWLDVRLRAAPSPIHGLGLFATEPIDPGELVMVLGGDVLTDAEVRELIARGNRYDGIALGEDANLRLQPEGWPGIHGNHSCDPNAWLLAAVDLVARRGIAPGEEVCSDYATYTMNPCWQMTCKCGAELCRRVVIGADWELADLQLRYADHFAAPIQRRIAARS
jgi:hypothetical protein